MFAKPKRSRTRTETPDNEEGALQYLRVVECGVDGGVEVCRGMCEMWRSEEARQMISGTLQDCGTRQKYSTLYG